MYELLYMTVMNISEVLVCNVSFIMHPVTSAFLFIQCINICFKPFIWCCFVIQPESSVKWSKVACACCITCSAPPEEHTRGIHFPCNAYWNPARGFQSVDKGGHFTQGPVIRPSVIIFFFVGGTFIWLSCLEAELSFSCEAYLKEMEE